MKTSRRPARRRAGLRALLPYLRVHRGALVVVAVLSLLETGGTLAQPLLTRSVLDHIQAEESVATEVVLLVVVLTAVAVISGVRDFMLQRTAEGLVLTTRRWLVAHLLRLPIAEYDLRRTGDLLSRVGADTTLLRAVVTSGLLESVTSIVMVVGSAIAMAVLDLPLFAAAVGGILVGLLAVLALARRMRSASHRAQMRMGDMTASVDRALSAVRTIRASGAEERESAVIDKDAQAAHDAGLDVGKLQALITPITTTTMQVAFLVVLGVGGARVADGAMSVGDLVAFVLLLFMLWFPLGRALNAYTRLQSGLGALHRIEEVFDLPQETGDEDEKPLRTVLSVKERTAPGSSAADHAGSPPAVEFDRVSFSYATGEQVLHDVSFSVPRGTRTALVGPSGAGKSTLLSLIERFYDVTGGTIRVHGQDVRDLPRAELRARLGYVEQEAPVLAGTLRNNLALTAPKATEDDMMEALRSVNLQDIVARTDDGLDAQVGEGGVLLSGGERQRLALARTFLARPPIMLLDEATSNLDARNEAAMRDAISFASADRTLVVVAHRLSTVVDSDQIVVVERGRVAAVGRHGELTGSSPLYRELASHQLLVN
ncbi:ABC transporter ATP-binding protein [Streptomyces kanamyceticus]|uniref:ABC transporter ATP-binding protein n=1 Tax=Streptomyces kanamyceticus TaxID=1967 RepID=A0A5J6GB30_STRKN|nr:ABC transporter ATP-binding protein [Streptomyces kanamyceticus]QEU91118.1 ABC transporter ATP-binding protein [Streptomyces kanamyceticus]